MRDSSGPANDAFAGGFEIVPLPSQVSGSSAATVTVGDAVVSGKLIQVLYIPRLPPSGDSMFASQLHKDDNNTRMDLHEATCCDGNLRPSRKDEKRKWHRYNACWSTPTRKSLILLLGDSLSSKPVFTARSTPTSSELFDARGSRMTRRERVPQRTRQLRSLSCGHADPVWAHTPTCTSSNGAILLRDEASLSKRRGQGWRAVLPVNGYIVCSRRRLYRLLPQLFVIAVRSCPGYLSFNSTFWDGSANLADHLGLAATWARAAGQNWIVLVVVQSFGFRAATAAVLRLWWGSTDLLRTWYTDHVVEVRCHGACWYLLD